MGLSARTAGKSGRIYPNGRENEDRAWLLAPEREVPKDYIFATDGVLRPSRNGPINFTICAKMRGLAAITWPL